jgi:predicted alpha/beta superfamily hydrolase
LVISFNAIGQEDPDYHTASITLHSAILQEDRELTIYQPASDRESLTTIYLLDGEWNFAYVKGIIDLFVRWNRIPDVRLVSVHNVNRTRDFTPTPDDERFPGSGQAGRFLSFVRDELIPYIEKEAGPADNRLIIGHSFGGLFALYSLFESPGLFDGYIAISPSVWWKDDFMLSDEYAARLAGMQGKPFVFLSTGEYDRGNVASGERYVDWLRSHTDNERLNIHFARFDGENHFTNVSISIHEGLSKYFPGPEVKGEIVTAYQKGGLEQLSQWFERQQMDLGSRFVLPSESILELALEKAREAEVTAAIEMLVWYQDADPHNGNISYYLGVFYEMAKDNDRAMTSFKKALNMNLPGRTKEIIRRKLKALEK